MGQRSVRDRGFDIMLGEEIAAIRSNSHLSLTQFSKTTGLNLTKSAILAIEKGRQCVSVFQLYTITNALGLSIDAILNRVHERQLIGQQNQAVIETL